MSPHAPPPDTLYLWYLGKPQTPVPVGELNLVMNRRGVSLRYASDWIAHGFALSEDLPLNASEYLPKEKDSAAGAVDDARPDRWGERVIRLLDRPPRLSVLEYLYYAGDDRFGALGVSSSAEIYLPREIGPLPKLADLDAVHEVVRRVLAREAVDERQKRLLAPGVTMGGARPKALFQLDGAEWVIKFAEEDRPEEPLIEHAAMTLAATAGITVAETRPIPVGKSVAVAVRRFDRIAGQRLHALSANVALKAAGVELSYPELALILRRRGATKLNQQQMRELFRRLVFNILIDNTDDHEKNHVLLVGPDQHYSLRRPALRPVTRLPGAHRRRAWRRIVHRQRPHLLRSILADTSGGQARSATRRAGDRRLARTLCRQGRFRRCDRRACAPYRPTLSA